jgi:hypothetical protein
MMRRAHIAAEKVIMARFVTETTKAEYGLN